MAIWKRNKSRNTSVREIVSEEKQKHNRNITKDIVYTNGGKTMCKESSQSIAESNNESCNCKLNRRTGEQKYNCKATMTAKFSIEKEGERVPYTFKWFLS